MNTNIFAGWTKVFSFTLRQTAKGKFRRTTVIMGICALAVGMAISVVMAFAQKDSQTEVSPIEKVYVINNSGLSKLDYEPIVENCEKYPNVSFEAVSEAIEELLDSKKMGTKDVAINIFNTDKGYEADLVIPEETEITKHQGQELLDDFETIMENGKIADAGIEEDKLKIVLGTVYINRILAGEQEKSVGEEVLESILPMIVSILLYFVVLIYGMNMGNAVSVEKTSKLMEMMLTFTRPYALILGKITALVLAAILQIFALIVGFVVGFFAGDIVATNCIYSEYENVVIDVLRIIKLSSPTGALSVASITLFCASMIISILFFCLLAATAGSFASKTEDVATYMSYFQLAAIVAYLVSIFLPMKKLAVADTLLRIVPLTSAFCLPSDILLGKVTPLWGSLYLLLLVAFTVVLVLISGKVYIGQLFYRGKKG